MDIWTILILQPFTNVLLFIYSVVGNFGIAIILFTIIIRLLTHPLMVKQIKSAAAMQELQSNPKWKEIQVKYKNDKEKLAQEQMKLQKELGVNPFASCLPLLIQFPIIIGLYQTLQQAIVTSPLQLLSLTRHIYPGFLNVANIIPIDSRFLWMDLGQPERLFIPGLPFGIPTMAIIVMVTTWMQSRLMQPPADPNNSQANMLGGMMNIYMPLLMGYLGLTLASGISLYFITSNLIGIGQYAMLGKVNWNNLNPFYKPQPVAAVKGGVKASKPIADSSPKETRSLPESSSKPALTHKSNGSGAAKAKKANMTKPVKSGSSKFK
ncbi:MAG TPA: membrane protein insertase YidC [Anaerolineaceae bacterium]|nr:membrane protein insertase YidC [Anaerolineaceae bacterium]